MIRNFLLSSVVPACIAMQLAVLPGAFGGDIFGGVGGVARDSASGRPVPDAEIVAPNLDKNTDRAAVTGTDGAFAIANLEPGRYQVAVTEAGFEKSSANVELAALGANRIDFMLAAATPEPSASASPTGLDFAKELEAMKKRIGELEAQLKNKNTQEQSSGAMLEVAGRVVGQEQRSPLLATTEKDMGKIPFMAGALARPDDKKTLASKCSTERSRNSAGICALTAWAERASSRPCRRPSDALRGQ